MKILTAFGNPALNMKLENLENVYVVGKDIQYQEGIVEQLEINKDIDVLIINETLPGEYGFYKLISEIKNIKKNIDVYIFLKEKDENKENYLVSKEIYKIFYLDEVDLDEFIKNFEDNPNDVIEEINKEIIEFKKLILNENQKNIDNYNFVEEKIFESFNINESVDIQNNEIEENCDNDKNSELYESVNEEKDCKVITISGNFGSGKSVVSSLLSKVISINNKKTLLIDFDAENYSINTIFGVKKYKDKQVFIEDFIINIDKNLDILCGIDKIINFKENINTYIIKEILENLKKHYEFIVIDVSSRIDFKYVKIVLAFCDKIIFLIEPNLLEISKSNKILEVFLNDFNIDVDKIKIIFNKTNKYKIAETVLEEIFSEFEIIEVLEYDEKYNLFINKNTNCFFEKEKFEKIYEKLISKKEEVYANTSVRN